MEIITIFDNLATTENKNSLSKLISLVISVWYFILFNLYYNYKDLNFLFQK